MRATIATEVKGQLWRLGSLLPCGFQGWNSGYQAWQQAPSTAHHPLQYFRLTGNAVLNSYHGQRVLFCTAAKLHTLVDIVIQLPPSPYPRSLE